MDDYKFSFVDAFRVLFICLVLAGCFAYIGAVLFSDNFQDSKSVIEIPGNLK